MSGESWSVSDAAPFGAEHTSMAERFASFGAYATWTATAPQPAAISLDVARIHAFTGEVTFRTEPTVRLYVDAGVVYHAERDGDPSIGESLIAAGVVDTVQLNRGTIRVGDVEHLGRLFERDDSIDRDAVLVAMERSTATIVRQLTASVAVSVTVNAYRHHPSGIHRWFVPQSGAPSASRPSSGVTQIDRSVVEELPILGGSPRPKLEIEWTEPDLTDATGFDSEVARLKTDRSDWVPVPVEATTEPEPDASVATGEFRITWPDGTSDESIVPVVADLSPGPSELALAPEEALEPVTLSAPMPVPAPLEAPAPLAPPNNAAALDTAVPDRLPEPGTPGDASPVMASIRKFDTPPLTAPEPAPVAPTDPDSVAPAVPVATTVAPVTLPMSTTLAAPAAPTEPVASQAPPVDVAPVSSAMVEPLRIDRIPQPDAAVPDDVAAAVRRALRAIEEASSRSSLPQPTRPLAQLPELVTPSFMEPKLPQQLDAAPPVGEQRGPSPHAATPPDATPIAAAPAAASVFDGADSFDAPVVQAPVSATPNSATPNSATPNSATPNSATPNSATPNSATPSSATPSSATPSSSAATASEPAPAMADPARAEISAPAPAPAPSLSFAPPTNDMRAEAVYERAAAEVRAELANAEAEPQSPAFTSEPADRAPQEPGRASVVFVDDEQTETSERRSALRRLIGSLRNKDS